MSIDLGDKTDILRIKEGDDPYSVAEEFCKSHELDESLIKVLE